MTVHAGPGGDVRSGRMSARRWPSMPPRRSRIARHHHHGPAFGRAPGQHVTTVPLRWSSRGRSARNSPDRRTYANASARSSATSEQLVAWCYQLIRMTGPMAAPAARRPPRICDHHRRHRHAQATALNGGYLRTQHGPAPITERAPVMVPVWRRIESARLISWARCWLPRPEHLVLGVCARGAPTRPAGAGRRTGAWKLGGAGGSAREKVAAWRPTGRDRRRTRASGRC